MISFIQCYYAIESEAESEADWHFYKYLNNCFSHIRTNIYFRYFNMAPNLFGNSATLFLEASQQDISQKKSAAEKAVTQKLSLQKAQNSKPKYQWKIVWRNVIAFVYLHLGALYGLYLCLTAAKLYTTLWRMFNINVLKLDLLLIVIN